MSQVLVNDMTDGSGQASVTRLKVTPRIILRAEHTISRANIDEKALKVLYRLRSAGFKAYLVGGSVRDLLLGREPKDFDVATDAHPEQVRELFRNCRLIGRRFRLAHIHFGQEIIEVATFRGHQTENEGERIVEEGRLVCDNVYGDIDEDAWRRDFTVNALYYNIEDFSVVDYVGGLEDIKACQLRLVGNPEQRYREDPVRMLRAVRFAVKLGFTIHTDTERPIAQLAPLLADIPSARLFEEVLKLFMDGAGLQTYERLRHYGLFNYLFPQTETALAEQEGGFPHLFVAKALANTDARIAEGKPVTPAFILAAMLWEPLKRSQQQHLSHGMGSLDALVLAMDTVISRQIANTAMPRRYTQIAREIWSLQSRFAQRSGKRPQRLLAHPRFRAAYDFLLLRADVGEEPQELAEWWTRYQTATLEERQELQNALQQQADKGGKRRRRRKKK